MTDQNRPQQVIVQPAQGAFGVATDTIGALRDSPTLLVMVLLNCAFLAALAYYLHGQQEATYKLVDKMFDRCLPNVRPP